MSGIAVAVADASVLIAAFDSTDPAHSACRQALQLVGHVVISPMELAEVDYRLMTGISPHAALSALRYIADKVAAGRFEVPDVGNDLHAAYSVAQRYVDFPLGLTDAMNVVLARDFRTNAIATLERRHFRAITPLTGEDAFLLLPDDS